MYKDISEIERCVHDMRTAAAGRDESISRVRLVRAGNIDQLFPDQFADDLPKSVVANIVDTAARDTAEMMAPLPSLACVSGNMTTASDEQRAGKKNKIGSYYWHKSRLAIQNIDFADSWNCYSFGAYVVEPDFEHRCPRITWESPFGSYYDRDRWGRLVRYVKVKQCPAGRLAAEYPEHVARIMNRKNGQQRAYNELLTLIRYMDKDETVIYLPECGNLVLARVPNPLSRLAVVVEERPNTGDTPRGQYDDVIWPTLARARMAQYMLKAADQAVNAPWRMPDDVTRVTIGPDAILRSQNPQHIGRVDLNIPRDVFLFADQMDQETRTGARYPEGRTGGIDANIITGKGVQALLGTMQTQITTAQVFLSRALEDVTSLCFEMDVTLWPNVQKRITGVLTGKPFELTYTPSRDIGDNWDCKTTYGFAAGQTPAQAIVALLQLRGDNLISRDTVRRQLPFDLDPEEEQRGLDQEQLEDALKQGMSALLQGLGPMIMQGQDPMPILMGAAKAIQMRQKGKALHEAIITALTPPEPEEPPAPEMPAEPGMPPGPGGPGGELPPGIRDSGLPTGVAYGQAGMPPGGMPSIQSLISGLRGPSAEPRMSAETLRKRATGVG